MKRSFLLLSFALAAAPLLSGCPADEGDAITGRGSGGGSGSGSGGTTAPPGADASLDLGGGGGGPPSPADASPDMGGTGGGPPDPADASLDLGGTGGRPPNPSDASPDMTGGVCTQDSECRLFDSYCRGCNCLSLTKTDPDPICSEPPVACAVAPCFLKRAACKDGHCISVAVSADPTGGNGACTIAADCRLFNDYCKGCNCRSLAKSDPDPMCVEPPTACAGPPCFSKTADCVAGHCTFR